MPTLETLATFVAVAGLLMALPGPSALLAVTRTVEGGRGAGLMTVLGLETGLMVHVVAATAGVSALLAASPAMLTGLRVAGAVFLLHLAWAQLRPCWTRAAGTRSAEDLTLIRDPGGASHTSSVRTRARLFGDGCLVDVLNPKTLVFFVAFLPQFVDREAGPGQLLVLGLVAVCLGLLFDSSYVLATSWLVRRAPVPRGVGLPHAVALASGAAYVVVATAALAGAA